MATTTDSSGHATTVYKLSQPIDARSLAQMRANLGKSGTGGDVQVSPDGLTLTIVSSKMPSHIWQAVAIAGAAFATAGIAGSLAGGTGAVAGIPTTIGVSGPVAGLPVYGASGALTAGGAAPAAAAAAAKTAAAGAGHMGLASDVVKGGFDLFGSLFGAHQQSQAQDTATRLQIAAEQKIAEQNAAASKYAADLQAKSSADALAFSRSGAENAFQNSEVSRQGNYDQWSAAQRRLGGVAHLIGMPDREIPTYRPGVDPHFDNGAGGPGGPAAPSGPPPSIDPSKGDLAGQISAYFKSRGVSDAETPYWVSKWSEFGANDPAYFNSRLAAADIFGRGGAPQAPPQAPPKPLNYNLSQYI